MRAPAHISEDSDAERFTKVVSKSRKHSVYTLCQKDRNCRACLRTEVARAPCSKLSLFKILPLNGPNPIRAKQGLHKRRKRVYESSSGRRNNQKLLKKNNSLKFGKSCEDLSWNHRTSTLHRMVLLWERQFEEVLLELGWEKVPNWGVCLFVGIKGYSYRYMWMTSKWLKRNRIWLPCERNCGNLWILANQHHFMTTYTWGRAQRECKPNEISIESLQKCSNHVLLEQLKK